MGIIVPAIIPVSREDLEQKLAQASLLCNEVQVDIVDGVYARPASWPYVVDAAEPAHMLANDNLFPHAGSLQIEIDLMSADPESSVGTWIGLGARRMTLHAESSRFLPRLIQNTHSVYGHEAGFASGLLSIGLAIGTKTDLALIEPYLSQIDYVQFMGVNTIGHQGEPFVAGVLSRIAVFRSKYPTIPIQVDGGVTLENAPKLLQAGVSRLVVGSALWKASDVAGRYRALDALTEQYGIYE